VIMAMVHVIPEIKPLWGDFSFDMVIKYR